MLSPIHQRVGENNNKNEEETSPNYGIEERGTTLQHQC